MCHNYIKHFIKSDKTTIIILIIYNTLFIQKSKILFSFQVTQTNTN